MEEYFLEKIDEGQEFKVCFMLHNAYWYYLEKLNKMYQNCEIDIYGRSLGYLKRKYKDFNLEKDYDYDLIISYRGDDGKDIFEISEIKKLATKISKEKDKKVTIGYTYYLPLDERIDGVAMHMVISSFASGEEIFTKDIPYDDATPYVLLDIVSKEHDELEKVKNYLKK